MITHLDLTRGGTTVEEFQRRCHPTTAFILMCETVLCPQEATLVAHATKQVSWYENYPVAEMYTPSAVTRDPSKVTCLGCLARRDT